jgi:hypothetical protein
VAMVAIVATSQKSRKRGSSLPFECRHTRWASHEPFPTAPARRPRALAAGLVGSRGMATMATMATLN